jgi:hypothetical protein
MADFMESEVLLTAAATGRVPEWCTVMYFVSEHAAFEWLYHFAPCQNGEFGDYNKSSQRI